MKIASRVTRCALVGVCLLAGCSGAPDTGEESTTDDRSGGEVLGESRQAAGCLDGYFHPNNGAHGGWVESWRLCHDGGNNYRICRGGSAPARYWNPSCVNGTVHAYYPQGWHGWVQTWGG
jgi:hypothetical protein